MSQLIANSMVHQRTLYQILMNETIADWATSYLHVQGQKKKKILSCIMGSEKGPTGTALGLVHHAQCVYLMLYLCERVLFWEAELLISHIRFCSFSRCMYNCPKS